ncbi:hypothetical protein P8452_55885 [Trifolium repens]|nr:hypothetical protein P8452_55885 [Trifolium repens]
MTGRGRDTQGKKATNKNRLRVMPPGSLAIANNRMRQQKKPSAAQRAVTAIQKVPSAVQKAQPVKAATPVQEPSSHAAAPVQEPPSHAAAPVHQEPPSHVATLVQAPPSQAATPVKTPPPTTTSEAFRFIPTPGFTLSRQFQQGPPEHTTHDIERDHRHQEDDQEHEERNQEVDEEDEIEEDDEEDNHDKDTCGKVIIRPMCNGFTPADVAAAAIRRVIEKTFPDNITCYSEVKDKARELWFKNFGKFVSWEPHHEHVIKANFHRNCGKRLTDIFTKARKKDKKPEWMNEEGWKYLTDRWKEDEFKTRSERNKTNRASSKGGALHTTGRKVHHDIALDMNDMLGRPVHPDELFMATHKKRNGEWVDRRSEKTHVSHYSIESMKLKPGLVRNQLKLQDRVNILLEF